MKKARKYLNECFEPLPDGLITFDDAKKACEIAQQETAEEIFEELIKKLEGEVHIQTKEMYNESRSEWKEVHRGAMIQAKNTLRLVKEFEAKHCGGSEK